MSDESAWVNAWTLGLILASEYPKYTVSGLM
jgi:hypothetical protein